MKASEGPESRRLFVNREGLIAEFLRRIHSAASSDVLFLYGEGGIGKSSLLDRFEDFYVRRLETPKGHFLDPWVNLSALPPRALVEQFSHLQSRPLPCARINFWERALGKDPREAFFGLQALRKRLKLPTPLFQSACVLYVHGTEGLTKEWMAELFPGDRSDFAVGLLDQPWTPTALAGMLHLVATGAPVAIPAVGVAALVRGLWGLSASLGGTALAELAAKRRLGNAIHDLALYKPHELLTELPRLLAEDLNASFAKEGADADRIVLLFDAYDRFVGSEHHLSSRDRFDRDAWFRSLLKNLRLEQGVIVVVTGQEQPTWDEEVRVCAHPVDYLSEPDARVFLSNANVEPEASREILIRYSSVAPEQVQPFFLALLVDAHRLAGERGALFDPEHLPENVTVQEQQKAVIDRLMGAADMDLRTAIIALSACRSFDWRAFQWLGEKLAFANFRNRFDTLTGLSCVRRMGESAFVMHSLIRRFLGGDKAARQIHAACRDYYLAGGDSAADAVYHHYFLDKKAAASFWVEVFRAAVGHSNHQECGALLAVRQELPASFAVEFADEAGEYLSNISRYDDAERELSIAAKYWRDKVGEENEPGNWTREGDALQRWAALRAQRSDHANAEGKYESAAEAYDRALALAPNFVMALCNKGNALARWAALCALRSDHVEAEQRYAAATEAYDRALALGANTPKVFYNRGNALTKLADLRALRGEPADAGEKYRASVESCDQALALVPDNKEALHTKGLALSRWGDLHARLSENTDADEKYGAALEAYDRGLADAPDFIEALINKGFAQHRWADLLARQIDFDGAEEKYRAAMESYDRALAIAPNSIETLNNMGLALARWADLRSQPGDHADAEEKYDASVEAYNRALAFAPNDPEVFSNKSSALSTWADWRARQNDYGAAEEKYGRAVEACDHALAIASNYIEAFNNKGLALTGWAHQLTQQLNYRGAEEKYTAAVAAFDTALAISSNYVEAISNKGRALTGWADLRNDRNDHEGAEKKYGLAVDLFDRALAHAPNLVAALILEGVALHNWSLMKLADGEEESAASLLGRSSRSWGTSLEISSTPFAYRGLVTNFVLFSQTPEYEKACEMLQAATEFCGFWEAEFPLDAAEVGAMRLLIAEARRRLDHQ